MRKTSIIMVFLLLINLFSVIPVFAWGNNLVSLDKTLLSLKVGDVATLTATISPANDNSLKWSTVDVDGSNVVQLDQSKGNPVTIMAQNAGTAVVTVRHGNRSATCKVTVGSALPPSSGNAGLSVDVNADQSKVTKPSDGPAEDDLNITLTPTGSAPTSNRPPVDIVFLFDKSGSMNSSNKIGLAKSALTGAVDFFSNTNNANINDRVGLVAFDSNSYSLVPLTTKENYGFQNVKNSVNYLYAYGGTNYTDALNKAINLFSSAPSTNSRKYVILLTDGMPTISSQSEQVNQTLTSGYFDYDGSFYSWDSKPFSTQTNVNYDSNYDPYPSKYIYNNGRVYYFPNMTFQSIENSIMDHGKEEATELAQMNVKLYSIGLGDMLPNTDMSSWSDQDAKNYMTNYLNLDYLESLSGISGATAQQALPNDSNSLNNIYQSLIQQINNQTMSGIQFKVKLPANVSLPSDTKAHMENGYAVLNMSDITFPTDGTTPSPINDILPLLFDDIGTYTFDDMNLYYTDLNGVQQTINIKPVTINVASSIVPVTGVTVDPATLNLKPADTYTLKANVIPSNATNQDVVWTSSDPTVAKVDSNGGVTAVKGGNVTITASIDNGNGNIISGSCSVTVAIPGDANLTNLTISEGTLNPTFNSSTLNYTDTVGSNITSVTVTPTWSDPAASVTVNGQTAVSGKPSGPIQLNNIGPTTISVVVTAEDRSQKTYVIVVTKEIPQPYFNLNQSGIVGDYVIVNINPNLNTIRDDTEWYKMDYLNGSSERQWVKFYTGRFPSNNGNSGVGVTLDRTVDSNGNTAYVIPQSISIKAATDGKESVKSLPISFGPSGINFNISTTNSSSGNRAAKVSIGYHISTPAGIKIIQFVNDTPSYIIKNSSGNIVMQGSLPQNGINADSTPVVKLLKSSSGSSQRFLLQAKIDMLLTTDTDQQLPLTVYSDPAKITIYSNENQQ